MESHESARGGGRCNAAPSGVPQDAGGTRVLSRSSNEQLGKSSLSGISKSHRDRKDG